MKDSFSVPLTASHSTLAQPPLSTKSHPWYNSWKWEVTVLGAGDILPAAEGEAVKF